MNAVNFIKMASKMCNAYVKCPDCPAYKGEGGATSCKLNRRGGVEAEEQIAIVYKWGIDHPLKTRQTSFLERFPHARLDSHGVLTIQPCELGYDDYTDCVSTTCYRCREQFWGEPVK